jgi:putative acetyltransferase
MHADTPPESIHMMDKGALAAPGIRFFVLRDGAGPVAMGAFKRIDATHAEIKSMHVLAEARGRGLSKGDAGPSGRSGARGRLHAA